MTECRGCGKANLGLVLDLGKVPAADHFPLATDPVCVDETSHALAMVLCGDCGLAQLADDDTVADEPRGVEPQALKDQAVAAIEQVKADGLLCGDTVLEFGSPHGGSWIPLLLERGYKAVSSGADVVVDCFGIMHEPDQHSAFVRRAEVLNPGGVLLLQYHSIVTIVEQCQWNALRHGHFAYYSLTTLMQLLGAVGLHVVTAWEFDLYGGTVLIAAVHGAVEPDKSVQRILATEDSQAITSPATLGSLQNVADWHADSLRIWLEDEAAAGRMILGYGAASRAVALFSRAGVDSHLLPAIADASPAKQGRRMPGTDIPIVSPNQLLSANPHRVLLTVPDLLPEVSANYPQLNGRWKVASALRSIHRASPERQVGE
jgi:C-methyltransferase-like protein/putative zinc binding protein